MGWRAAWKLSRVGKLAAPALANAERFPLREDTGPHINLGEMLGDTIGLASIRGKLWRGWTGWTTDPSEDARKLRDIAGVLEEWAELKNQATDSGDARRDNFQRRKLDRYTLAVVGWILVGKTLDEIRDGEGISGTERRP